MTAATFPKLPKPRQRARGMLLGRTALCGVLSLGVAAAIAARPAKAEPTGGAVVQGGATIQTSGSHTQINQTSQNALITWQDFSIGSAESVAFAQPNTRSVAMNKVISSIPSHIQGQLTANGQVWIINPNGVFVSAGAAVNVGGLMATSSELVQQDWDAGKYTFDGAPLGSQVNVAGAVTATDGSIVLVAPVVDVSGSLTAAGDVALGAGGGFAVDFHGDGLTRFAVDPASGARLNVSGTISAQGGAAYLLASATDAVEDAVVSIGGQVEASRIEERGGVIVISGGDTGVTEISGTVDASQAEGAGGEVTITGGRIALTETASVSADGATGGGTVEIGGGFQGAALAPDVVAFSGAPAEAPLPTAKRTYIAAGAEITANAGAAGDGGTVILWADEIMGFFGALSATGGATGGDGGFAEVSGKDHLIFDGTADLTAAFGKTGTVLLDPLNITIGDAGANDGLLADNQILFAEPDAVTSITISDNVLEGRGADFLLQASGSIFINFAIDDGDVGGPNTNALTFQANLNINVNADVTLEGALTMTADADNNGTGSIDFLGGADLFAADIVLSSTAEAINFLGTSTVSATAASDLTLGSPVTTVASETVTLEATNDVSILGSVTGSGDLIVVADTDNAGGGTVFTGAGASLSGNSISLTGADITLTDGTITATNGVTIAHADGGIGFGGTAEDGFQLSDAEADLIESALTLDAAGDIVVNGVTFDQVTVLDATGRVDFETASSTFDQSLTVIGTEVDIDGSTTLTVSSGTLTLTNAADDELTVGGADAVPAGQFIISDADLGRISASSLAFVTGRTGTSGQVTVTGSTLTGFSGVSLSGTEIDFVSGGAIDLADTGTITLINAGNDATQYGGDEDPPDNSSTFRISDADFAQIDAGTLVIQTGGGTITNASSWDFDGTDFHTFSLVNTGGDINLSATGGTEIEGIDTLNLTATDVSLANNVLLQVNDNGTINFTHPTGGKIVAGGGGGDLNLSATELEDRLAFGVSNAKDGTLSFTTTGEIEVQELDFSGNDGPDTLELTASANRVHFNQTGGNDDSLIGLSRIDIVAADVDIDNGGNDDFLIQLGSGGTFNLTNSEFDLTTLGGGANAEGTPFILTNAEIDNIDVGNSGTFSVTSDDGDALTMADRIQVVGVTGGSNGSTSFGALDLTAGYTVEFLTTGSDFDNDLTVAAGGNVTQGVAITVSGDTSITAFEDQGDLDATNDVFFDITLNNAGNQFDRVDATGNDIQLTNAGAIELGDLTANTDMNGGVDLGDVTVTAGGTITDTNDGTVSVTGTTSLLAESGGDYFDIVLDDGPHQFGTLTATGEDIEIVQAGDLALGAITVTAGGTADSTIPGADGSLFATATGNGDITQTAALTVPGTASFTADGNTVTLANVANDFNEVDANAATVTLYDTNDIVLDDVTVTADLSVTAEGGIDDADGAIDVDGTTNLLAQDGANYFDILLDTGDHVLGTVNAEGEDISLRETDPVALGTIIPHAADGFPDNGTNTGDLTVVAAGGTRNITQGATALFVPGTAIFTATGDVVLTNIANDFNIVSASAENVTLFDTDNIVLDDFTVEIAGGGTGDLTVTAEGSITDTAGSTISVEGTTSLLALDGADYFDIQLDSGAHELGTIVASGEDITLSVDGDLVFGATTTHADAVSFIDNPIAGSAGNLLAIANGDGDISQTGALTVAGTSNFSAVGNTITLDDVTNDFTGAVSANGTTIVINDANALTTGTITGTSVTLGLNGQLAVTGTVTSPTATINDGAGLGFALGDSVWAPGTRIAVNSAEANSFTGDVTFNTTADIRVGQLNFDDGIVQASTDLERMVTLNADSSMRFDSGLNPTQPTFFEGDLVITTNGAVDDIWGLVTIAGTTSITAGSFVNLFNNHDFGGVVAVDATSVSLRDANNITLGDIDTAGNLTVTAGTFIFDSGATIAGQGLDVGGATTLTAGAGFNVLVDDAVNTFGGVFNASGANISVRDTGSLTLGDIDATASLTAVSGGAIDDGAPTFAGGDVNVTGATTLTAVTSIDLGDAFNAFGGAVNATGTDITLTDADTLQLGAIDADGNLTATALAGNLFDTAGSSIDVEGATTLSASGAVTLDNIGVGAHDFDSDDSGDLVSARGTAVTLTDADDILLGDIEATSLDVTATAGSIGDGAEGDDAFAISTDIDVSGATTLTASTGIDLDDTTNDFGGAVDASTGAGPISLADATGLILGTVTAPGADQDLTITSGGSVTDMLGMAITIGGNTSIMAGGPGNYYDVVLDGGGFLTTVNPAGSDPATSPAPLHDFNTVVVEGEDIHIRDINAIEITAFGHSVGGADGGLPFNNVNVQKAGGGALSVPIDSVGSVLVESGGLMTINEVHADGDMLLVSATDFHLKPDTTDGFTEIGVPLIAGGDINLIALNGTFLDPAVLANLESQLGTTDPAVNPLVEGAYRIPGGTTMRAEDGDIAIVVRSGFKVVVTGGQGTPPPVEEAPLGDRVPDPGDNVGLVFDIQQDHIALISIADGEFAVGSDEFINGSGGINNVVAPSTEGVIQAREDFDALAASSVLGPIGGGEIFIVSGHLALESRNTDPLVNPVSFYTQNTGLAGAGGGMRVDGLTYVGKGGGTGDITSLDFFGSFNNTLAQIGSLTGFAGLDFPPVEPPATALNANSFGRIVGVIGPVPRGGNLFANNCLLFTTSCQPIGRLVLLLDVEDGSLLAFRFQDDEEEEDDQFSNRGDEEDWQ